jgi:hypothetical protein
VAYLRLAHAELLVNPLKQLLGQRVVAERTDAHGDRTTGPDRLDLEFDSLSGCRLGANDRP